MSSQNMPPAEVDVGVELLRGLLEDQHPDLGGEPIALVANGWDNVIFRIGDALCARLPRREMAAALVVSEHRWLPELAPALPLPIPVPVRTGVPGRGYPWRWTVCGWFRGRPAITTPLDDLEDAARALGGFVAALHVPAPPGAPVNPYRGVPLNDRTPTLRERVAQLGDTIDGDAVLAMWEDIVATPRWPGAPLWIHGDLHPGNLLVDGGRLSAVIDFGDLNGGDPATDLMVAWMLFPPEIRPTFRAAAGGSEGIDDDTWRRGRGWALACAVAVLANSADNPPYAELGRRTLSAALAG